jgi:acetyl esterase
MTATEPDDGAARFREVLGMLSGPDPRGDIDTASLVRRFPALGKVEIRDVEIEGPHGVIQGRLYRAPGAAETGFVWVHGGAFIAGGLDMPESNWVALEIAARGIPVLALDYRKALDGVHHPVLSDEVLVAWRAATEDPALLNIPTERLHLGGASAGANLSAGVAVRARGGEAPMPASLVLVYPAVHSEVPAPSPEAAVAAEALPAELRFSPGFMREINRNYVGDDGDLLDPIAFPGNGPVQGLPATLIINAEADDLRASGDAFGAQLDAAGVPVVTEFEPGTVHGYLDQPGLPAAIATIDRIVAWLSERTPR